MDVGHGDSSSIEIREDFSGSAARGATGACKVAESDTVSRMPAASRFVDALKKSVRARGLTYAELAKRLQLSEASHARAARDLCALADDLGHGRVLALGGGGYNRGNLARGWCAVAEALLHC